MIPDVFPHFVTFILDEPLNSISMKHFTKIIISLLILLTISISSLAQLDVTYQVPPEEILQLADASPTPAVWISDDGQFMVLFERSNYITLEELAAEEYRLAGLRIDPATNGPSRSRYYYGIVVKDINTGIETTVKGLPEDVKISNTAWSPDQTMIGFTHTGQDGLELWVLDVASAEAKKLTGPELNDVFYGNPYVWEGNNRSLLCRMLVPDRKKLSGDMKLPAGPVVQENIDSKAPARTYQDLLKNKQDEEQFEYFATSRLVRVGIDGEQQEIYPASMIRSVEISPDGRFLLLETINKPFSYMVPYYRFGFTVSVLDHEGNTVKDVIDVPLTEVMPKGFMAVRKGPRDISWRNDEPATIYWVEALDQGDPEVEAAHRDEIFTAGFPFDLKYGESLLKTVNRFRGVTWGTDGLAVAYDYWWKDRNSKTYLLHKKKDPEVIFDLNTEDLYNDPGNFVTEDNEYGKRVLAVRDGKWLYLTGQGYGPEGNRPFFDMYQVRKKEATRLWQAEGKDTYENIVKVLDPGKGEIITSVESVTEYPQFFVRNVINRSAPIQITQFPNPYESMKGITKEFIQYKRDDGVDLSATLYLPKGYNKEDDGALPTILWAYPREYKDARAAGQVKTSPHRFTYLYYGSPVYWVAKGYAIIDRADFPIIGEGDEEPNDSFIGQLVANAKAAIDYCTDLGVTDPESVAVGGHSYGAFMTANLLTHSDLFAAGIARSGAYNRTLTPFGFQAEERTYWEAPEVYYNMSPFMHADEMKTPLLLIHGELDNNSGTFPMQSERYYDALKGHGATVRLVVLPYESHGYSARENIMHMLWEQDAWLERWLKGDE